MKHEFDVDGFHYITQFKNSEFFFYIDTLKSHRLAYEMTKIERGLWDDPPERVIMTSDLTNTSKSEVHNVFKVKHEVLAFIEASLSRYRPYYFCFRTLEPAKLAVYDRIATRLAKRYGYYKAWDPAQAKFMFFRLMQDR